MNPRCLIFALPVSAVLWALILLPLFLTGVI